MATSLDHLIVLSDKTITPFCRELQRLQGSVKQGFTISDAGYDSWLREILDPASATCSQPQASLAFVLSPRILDVPDVEGRISQIIAALDRLQPHRTVLFSLVVHESRGASPLLNSVARAVRASRINSLLAEARASRPWLILIDQPGLHFRLGSSALHDARFEASAQMYYSPGGQKHLAGLWHRALCALRTVSAKVLIVDLDNTLWRGVLGEDGADGIQMGADAIGWPHRQLQLDLLTLKQQGIVLALASKNNREEAIEVLANHPDCLLRPDDFAAIEIHWEPKSTSIGRISQNLGLGLDSFVFLDDSAFERNEVQQALPQVRVLPFPSDAMGLLDLLSSETAFDVLSVTDEDRTRSAGYVAEAKRADLRASATSAEDFFRSLELHLHAFRLDETHVPRVHQLTNKTNQFNLTTERLTEIQVRERVLDPSWLCLGLRVSDRLGDSGFTGVLFVNRSTAGQWIVENFLLSCRVIGRTVEHAIVSLLAREAEAEGVTSLSFRFIANSRNVVARQFMERSGLFSDSTGTNWSLRLPAARDALPVHFVQISYRGDQR
jgi:FkbH-like protein